MDIRVISPYEKALKLQKRIFRSLKNEVERLLGNTPVSIRRYEEEYKHDLQIAKKRIRRIEKPDLIEAIRNVDVTFIGDFHVFDQAQRTALRIIRETVKPDENWLIGLELIPTDLQNPLNQYLANQISTEEFHRILSYSKEWGFPWKNYAPIFTWAAEKNIPIIALNQPQSLSRYKGKKDLTERDHWAAKTITNAFHVQKQLGQHPKMIVLYGELHISSRHIPFELERVSRNTFRSPLSWISIHQNDEHLFWRFAKQRNENPVETVQLKKNVFCLFSSNPWTKLQSLVNWLEGDPIDLLESEPDYLSLMKSYGETLSKFFSIRPPSFEGVSLFTIEDAQHVSSTLIESKFSVHDQNLIRFLVAQNERLYLEEVASAYLGTPSINGVAELAASHLFKTRNPSSNLSCSKRADFYRLVLEFSFGFLGSLILNPHRRCDLSLDHLNRIHKLSKGAKSEYPLELEARRVAVGKFDIGMLLKQRGGSIASFMAAKYVGRILGKKLHKALLDNQAQLNHILLLFLDPSKVPSHSYENRYEQLEKKVIRTDIKQSKFDSF